MLIERKSGENPILASERISEVDLMSAIYPLSVHRRVERQWAQRIDSLRRSLAGTEKALQRVFNNDGALVGVPESAVADRRHLDQPRSHD
jgi:hypothetical protein